MSSAKTKGVLRLESEIEKFRCEAKWGKAIDLSKQVISKSPSLDILSKLLVAEKRLEEYLFSNPPTETNIFKAKNELREVEGQFQDIIKTTSQKKDFIYHESSLLLSKLYYAMGQHEEALSVLDEIDLDHLTTTIMSTRLLRLVGEGFAVKGMCLENIPKSKSLLKYKKKSELEKEIINCYEKSGNLTLLHLQERDKVVQNNSMNYGGSSSSASLGHSEEGTGLLLESALQRSSILHIHDGNLFAGINRFREILQAVETRSTQSMRQTLARQLAEVLLRGTCATTYELYKPKTNNIQKTKILSESKPRMQEPNEKIYVPGDAHEEALLLLLISEAVANREAVLERAKEHEATRLHSFQNATTVYDLLTIALVRRSQFDMLSENFERAMKFSFDEFHIWYQFALSLISAEKYSRAVLVLKECARLQPSHAIVSIQAAKLCFEELHMIDEGIECAQHAVRTSCTSEWKEFSSKAYVALGIGYSLKSLECKNHSERKEFQEKALEEFLHAQEADGQCHLPAFHIALQLAIMRRIAEALTYVQKALQLKSDHIHSLHLLALLLSAQKHFTEALVLIKAALDEYPEDFSLLFTKSKLEEIIYGEEEALCTCKNMLNLWKETFESGEDENEDQATVSLSKLAISGERKTFPQLTISELEDRDSGSIRESLAASKVEAALSEIATSLSGSYVVPKQTKHHSWTLQCAIWLHLAEMYLAMDKPTEANNCVNEATAISPVSYQVAYMKGRIHEYRNEYYESKQQYESAIGINPTHVKSLQHLGTVLHTLGDDRMAEKILRDAVTVDTTSHQTWKELGIVLQALGEHDAASDCLMTSVSLEGTSPVQPFSAIPRSFD